MLFELVPSSVRFELQNDRQPRTSWLLRNSVIPKSTLQFSFTLRNLTLFAQPCPTQTLGSSMQQRSHSTVESPFRRNDSARTARWYLDACPAALRPGGVPKPLSW